MNVFQVRAYFPELGDVNVLGSPSLEEAAEILKAGVPEENGLKSASLGGAVLLPYANRIRGKLSVDGTTIETQINRNTVNLPANWQGKSPGAERHSIHGLIMAAKFEDVRVCNTP